MGSCTEQRLQSHWREQSPRLRSRFGRSRDPAEASPDRRDLRRRGLRTFVARQLRDAFLHAGAWRQRIRVATIADAAEALCGRLQETCPDALESRRTLRLHHAPTDATACS